MQTNDGFRVIKRSAKRRRADFSLRLTSMIDMFTILLVFLLKNLGQICDLVGMEINKEFGGKKVYAAHMPTQGTIDAIALSGKYDIILTGHTHSVENKKYDNGVLVVNPGEACGYLSNKSTFAIIDTEKMEAEIIEL